MDIHKNARLTPLGRERMVKMVLSGQTPQAVSEAVGVCPRTVRKWVDRYEREGLAGLQDRSSRPRRLHHPTPQSVIERIEGLRRQRLTGQAIAAEVGISKATVSRVLKRLGLNKLSALELAEPPRRYERERPGEMIPIDIKKLGKFAKATAVSWDGSSSMSASMTPHALPSPRSSRTNASEVPSPSSRPPSSIMQASASPSNAS
jgi:transposase